MQKIRYKKGELESNHTGVIFLFPLGEGYERSQGYDRG